ncbi:hypothetical protein QTL44_004529 [Escherichia coli]|nr:hypothetical protein [Escherichia coli]
MKLRSVTYALFIAGLAAFSTSSLAAQSLRFGALLQIVGGDKLIIPFC